MERIEHVHSYDNEDQTQRMGATPRKRTADIVASPNDLERERELSDIRVGIENWLATNETATSAVRNSDLNRAKQAARQPDIRSQTKDFQIGNLTWKPINPEEGLLHGFENNDDDYSVPETPESLPANTEPIDIDRNYGQNPLPEWVPQDSDISGTNHAIALYEQAAARFETASRAASWGTERRRSDGDLVALIDESKPATLAAKIRDSGKSIMQRIRSARKSHGSPPEESKDLDMSLESEVPVPYPLYPSDSSDQSDGAYRIDKLDEPDLRQAMSSNITPDLVGFRTHVRQLYPRLDTYLVDRIAQDQVRRYKRLVKNRIDHSFTIKDTGRCSSGEFCGDPRARPSVPASQEGARTIKHLQNEVGLGDDGDSAENTFLKGVVTSAHFPPGIPLPPATHLPAIFECPLCFQVKKVQTPSKWTEHVYEDVQPYSCTFPSCPEPKSFKRKSDWIRHENERHRHLEWWKCNIQECAHICYRRDNFIQHLVREHKLQEPKGTSQRRADGNGIQRIVGLNDSIDVLEVVERCHHANPQRAAAEPCKFCGQRYRTWKALSNHVAFHFAEIAMPVLELAAKRVITADTVVSPIEPLDTRLFSSFEPQHDSSYSYPLINFGLVTGTDSGYASIPRFGGTPLHSETKHSERLDHDHTFDNFPSDVYGQSLATNGDTSEQELSQMDNKTDYSVATSVESVRMFANISDIAEHLKRCLPQDAVANSFVDRLCTELPSLLKTFAVRLGGERIPGTFTDGTLPIAFFIHKHASLISNDLYQQCANNNEDMNHPRAPLPGLALQKPDVSSWLEAVDSREQQSKELDREERLDNFIDDADSSVTESEHDDREIDTTTQNHQFLQRLEIVQETPAYRWLRDALYKLVKTTYPNEVNRYRFKDSIKEYVRRFAPQFSNKISKSRPPAAISAVFYIHWNPFLYFGHEDYNYPRKEALTDIITITGIVPTVQAATVSQYIEQTWPTTGRELLNLAQCLLNDRDRSHRVYLSDNSAVKLSSLNGYLRLEIDGVQDSVIEIVEMFSWLGTVLRAPSQNTNFTKHESPQISTYTPRISRLTSTTGLILASDENGAMVLGDINFDCQVESLEHLNGHCWRYLFGGKSIARGFPILARSDEQPGLELPLNMMTALIGTKCANVFNDTVYIKGFSSMLVPTQYGGDVLMWHLLFKENGGRISYLDLDLPVIKDIAVESLQSCRHIVGWCLDAKTRAGTQSAQYTIDRTDLPRTGSACILEKINLSGGMYVTGGASVVLNQREKPIRISRNGQRDKMEWLQQKYIVLWDQGESRGWLVNGTTALLHLTLSSLKHDERLRKSFKFPWNRLIEAEPTNKPYSAYDILIDQSNLEIELYSDKTEIYREVIESSGSKEEVKKTKCTYFLLADRIEELYMLIEKMVDYQTDALSRGGIKLKSNIRKHLEGWEFKDLYTKVDPINPRVMKLPVFGDGWVDLVHSLEAITLFGNGFGELIQPNDTDLCSYWTRLPCQEYYLAACVSDLQSMIELLGTSRCDPIKLTHEIFWRRTPIQRCQCATSHQHSSVALALETKCKPGKPSPAGEGVFGGYAAVVLSHKRKVARGGHRNSTALDSGLGSSIESSIIAPLTDISSSTDLELAPSLEVSASSAITDPSSNVLTSQSSRKRTLDVDESAPTPKRSTLSIRQLLNGKFREDSQTSRPGGTSGSR